MNFVIYFSWIKFLGGNTMNFFENDYTQNATQLFKEAIKLKKYKAMNPVLAIFTAIFMLPLIVVDAFLLCALYVWGFLYNLMFIPVKFIHDVLKAERGEVMHAAQAVLYLVSWPIVFTAYTILSLTVFALNCIYALTAIFAYIWTLGGFKFHVSVVKLNEISIKTNGKLLLIPLIYIIVCAVIIFVWPFISTLAEAIKYEIFKYDGAFKTVFAAYKAACIAKVPLTALFSILYSAIAFGPRPGVKAENE